jgi:hypothetical protein
LAETLAAALSVKVHVLVLFPPLEHAPDQTASRPLVTLSVICVPAANGADPELPTATLMPAGLDVTRSPLRPLAVTVSVTVVPCGVTLSDAVRDTPALVAVIVTGVAAPTAVVVAVKFAAVLPDATVTLPGTVAAVLLLLKLTINPPAGAALVSVTVPCEDVPPTILVGFSATADNDAAGGGDVTVRVVVRVTPPALAVMLAEVDVVTAVVVIAKVAVVLPCATVTLAGTVAALLALLRVTGNPPAGAGAVSVTVPVDALGPVTVDGLTLTALKAAGALAA